MLNANNNLKKGNGYRNSGILYVWEDAYQTMSIFIHYNSCVRVL